MNQWHHCVLEMCTTVCPWFFHYSLLIVTDMHASAFRKCSSQRLKVFEETLRVKLTHLPLFSGAAALVSGKSCLQCLGPL